MEDLRALVTYASVHGSTAEIARAIALTLSRAGVQADVVSATEVPGVGSYDVVIVGSAVYGGRWRREALGFLNRFGFDLFGRDVWFYQSGPLGHSAQAIMRALPDDVRVFAEYLRAKGVATFGGKLDGASGGPVSRFLARAGFDGDYRDFNQIRVWAENIACRMTLKTVTADTDSASLARAETR